MSLNGREAALNALLLYHKNGHNTEKALEEALSGLIDGRELSLAYRMFYSVLQNKTWLDYLINCFSTCPVKKMQPLVLEILRLMEVQVLYFDRVPDFSAVSEAVSICKKRCARASGLVNAVGRRITENRASLPEPKGSTAYRLSVRYSHPLWFTERFCQLLGEDACEALLRANNSVPPIYLHVNPLKGSPDLFKEMGLKQNALLPDCFEVPYLRGEELKQLLKEGKAYVQDPAALMAVLAASPQPDMKVVDVCAAPGGKSIASALLMQNRGEIRSFDISEKKLSEIEENAVRLGVSVIQVSRADARERIPELEASADIVLVDVPCSGFGVIRKKPEIREKTEAEISVLPDIQLAILKNASAYVKTGGTLLYSTCTILPEENEQVFDTFLKENHGFVPDDFEIPVGVSCNGKMTLYPQQHDTDGFFIGKMKRQY